MSNKQVISIFCDGGFGNRLNTLISGLAVANIFDLKPVVFWPRNNWCQAAFGQIFSATLDVSESSLTDLAGTLDNSVALLHDTLGSDTLKVAFQSAYAYDSLADFEQKVVAGGKPIFYYPALIPPWLPMEQVVTALRSCTYRDAIRDIVVQFVGHTIGKPFYGLHLRRTDLNVGCSDEEVQDIVRQHASDAFFVCSDDPIAEALAAAHPNVYRRDKTAYVGKRNDQGDWMALTADDDGRLYHSNIDRNADSVVDAVIDMLILAHSSIVGFSGSTFQNMARLYGIHAPLVSIERPPVEMAFVAQSNYERMVQSGALSLADCVGHFSTLYNEGRKAAAIALEKKAIESGLAKGQRDSNMFVLHYNLAAHLINEQRCYEASLYLEKALGLIPDHAQTMQLLALARQRAGMHVVATPWSELS
jgi:tetratricopeptide (TPR) repeat protein